MDNRIDPHRQIAMTSTENNLNMDESNYVNSVLYVFYTF